MAMGAKATRHEAAKEMKSQTVRLLDVFAIGPLMIWGGLKATRSNEALGILLAATGVLTILYNGKNYLENKPTVL